jgi:hypothetical protein
MLLFQLLLDEVFTHAKRYSSKLIWWDFNRPFLSQPVCFLITRYSLKKAARKLVKI